jgi:hypothetical protein
MILNNHLYNLYFKNKKTVLINKIFEKYINSETENNEFYLNIFLENTNLIKKIIQSLDNDNLDITFLSYQIINIYFNHNELSIKNLPEMFDVLLEILIFIELIIHIHILLLNIYFFNSEIISKYIKLTNINDSNKSNNYLMLIDVLINICGIFETYYNKFQNDQNKIIMEYLEDNKGIMINVLNFNLDNTIIQILELIDTEEKEKYKNEEENTNNNNNNDNNNDNNDNKSKSDVDQKNKNILINMISNMFNHYKNNIMNLIEIFIKLFEKIEIFIPENEKKNIFIIISTVFNYNIVKLKS